MHPVEFVLRIVAAVSILLSSTPLALANPPGRSEAQAEAIIPPAAGEPTPTPQPEPQPEGSPEFQLWLPLLFKDNRPQPAFSATPLIGSLPLTVTFANSSTTATAFEWDFGDGSHLTQNSALSTQNSVTHVYTRAGVYSVTLTAAADTGLSQSLTRPNYLTVLPPADEANLFFIENTGQFADAARFVVPGEQGTLFLAEDALWLSVSGEADTGAAAQLRLMPAETDRPGRHHLPDQESRSGVNLKLSFPGANPQPKLEPFNRLETTVSYFSGNDPDQWQTDVPVWGGVRYMDLYPGIDLEVTSEEGQLVQRLVARDPAAGQPAEGLSAAAINQVSLRIEGAEAVTVAGDALQLQTAIGEVSWPLLEQVTVEGNFVPALAPPVQVSSSEIVAPFAATAGEASDGLAALAGADLFDLLYSTFLGSGKVEWSDGIAVDAAGNAYVTGSTWSSQFPTTAGAFDTTLNKNHSDVFVAKINPSGSGLVYSTFLGGKGNEEGYDLAIDAAGNAYVSGYTASSNFPATAGAFDTRYNGGVDAFIAKINPAGSGLVYGTFLGGSGPDNSDGIAVDAAGNAYVTGSTWSANFPTTAGAVDTGYNGNEDAYVVKLNPSGSGLVYGTFLGGNKEDEGYGLVVDAAGNAYITGYTVSADFPTTSGAFDTSYNGKDDVFVTRVNPDGTGLVYSTFLGGSRNDGGVGIALDAGGNASLTGYSYSADFPTTPGAFDESYNGWGDAFVTRVNPAGSGLAYSTFLGDGSADWGNAITVDAGGNAYVTGLAGSFNFPTTPGAFDENYNGWGDAFVTRVNPAGSGLAYSTFLGGGSADLGSALTLDTGGNAYVTGLAGSFNFPTTPGAFDRRNNGWGDVFVTKLALGNLPTAGLSLVKTAPALALAGQPLTYTLTVTNTGQVAATHLVVTDTLPAGASYLSGGTKSGNMVSWNLASLAAGQVASFSFVVTATTTLTNSDYGVTSDDGLVSIGQLPVTTRVYPAPIADFSAFPLSGSWPLLVQFLNSSTGADSYIWDFGDGITSTLASPTHTYAATGLYTVTLSAANPAASHTLARPAFINAWSPVAVDFAATPLTGAAPLTVTLANSSTGATGYEWDFGDGSTAAVISPTHVYTQAGVYTVSLAAGNGVVTDTLTQPHYLTVTEALVVDFSAFPPQGTAPLLVQFLNNSTGATAYQWAFGDGITSTLPSPTHTYAAAGVYTVTLTAGNEFYGPLTRTHYLTVTTPVVADFAATPLTGTIPLTVSFSNNSTGATGYEWDFGDGSTGAVISPTHVYTTAGVYTVTLAAGNGLITHTLSRPGYLTVTEALQVDFAAAPLTGVAPLIVTFVNSSTNATGYLWDFGTGATLSVISPTYTYNQPGVYTVTLTATGPGGSQTVSRTNYITVTAPISRDWALLTTPTTPPVWGEHSLAYDSARGVVVLYGGNAAGWPYENATWEFDGADWQAIATPLSPTARYGTTLAFDPARRVMVLFGGGQRRDTALNQTWEYTQSAWINVSPATAPVSRTYASMVANPLSGVIYLFGGNDHKSYFNDMWRHNDGNWAAIDVNGTRPISRTLAAMTWDSANHRLLLFGGRTVTGALLADLWAFDPTLESWTELDDGSGNGPAGRMAHSLTYDPDTDQVVLAGGITNGGDTRLGDTWHFQEGEWVEAAPAAPLPPRAWHQAVYTDHAILLFSGGQLWRYR